MPSPEPVYPSRLPRESAPPGPDGRPATRWTDPRLAAAYCERDDAFDQTAVWPVLASALAPVSPRRDPGRPDGTVLELGCGAGAFARHLAERNWLRVHAVDRSPAMHRFGDRLHHDAWIERSLPGRDGRLAVPSGSCTSGVCALLLAHLPHSCTVIGVLSEGRRALRRDAPFLLVEPIGPDGSDPTPPVEHAARPHTGRTPSWDAAIVAPGAPYVVRYPLRDGSALPVTAWRHSPDVIAHCLDRSGFALDEITPIAVPGTSKQSGLLLYRARAR